MSSLSIVATVYNDAEIVPLLVAEIIKNIPAEIQKYEIILVNDYSRDNSEEAIIAECKKNTSVKGISLNRNFGQQIAMSAGMQHASGDLVVIMDGDLQNPPSAIPILISKVQEGYDIVYTASKKRNGIIDAFTSYIFWALLTKIFKMNVVKHQLMLKIMTKEFIQKFNKYGENTRTIDAIVADISSNYTVLPVENQKRKYGRSNYNFFKRANITLDMIISLSSAPLNFMIYLGLFIFLATIIGVIYYIGIYLFDTVPPGYTSMQLSIFFFGGLTILVLGIIGRYLSGIYAEVRRRPLFHIKKTYNL
ncbi:MAG TPA: glycosyltransferase family 2 protein [Bacteroidia bacterium]|jgi:glycosyltransferase involved in cell wall biosynthesis|nr:glycosyltransferase family 2 protein [Bacteroidia bacterium]